MRLPNSAHTSRPWRIHDLTGDFRIEDVWALPASGGPNEFPRLVEGLVAGDPARGLSGAARALWQMRFKIGGLLGLDGRGSGLGSRVQTLRDRLPQDLRSTQTGPVFVKPNGLLGAGYMAAIKPFRYLVVYPAMMRSIARDWRA